MEYFRQRFMDNLDEGGPVTIGKFTWPNSEIFEVMAKNDFEASLVEWVGEKKAESKARARGFLAKYGSLERFNTMMDRHHHGHVLPFVGAGMSCASGYLPWGPFLLSLLDDAPPARIEVAAHLALYEYEEAAQRAHDALTADTFAEEIHNAMGSHRRHIAGPVCLLPQLFRAEVFTTNFDYVLNHSYAESDQPFVRQYRGSELRQAAQRMGNEPHCLLRLHGEADVPDDRVLTMAEYEAAYDGTAGLEGALGNLIGARSILFLGSSLHTDRTFDAFRQIKTAAGGVAVRHYAFLPFPGAATRQARRAALGEAEIHPIYYPPGEHDQCIEDLLLTMIDGGF